MSFIAVRGDSDTLVEIANIHVYNNNFHDQGKFGEYITFCSVNLIIHI